MRGKYRSLLSGIFLLLFAMIPATAIRARTAVQPAQAPVLQGLPAPGTGTLEPIADGTKDPASISDEIALRVLFLTNPGAADPVRLKAKFAHMKLKAADMTILLQQHSVLNALASPQRAGVTAAREALQRNPSRAALDNLSAADHQLDLAAANTYRQLLGSLSAEGAAKLREHVAYIKTKIKVLPPPNMAAHNNH
jgi:hypothetical protein